MKQLQRIFRRGIAATLCCAMLLQSTCVYAAGDEISVNNTADTSVPSVKTYGNDGTETGAPDNLTDSNTNNNDNAADNGSADRTENSAADAAAADFSAVYADGMIRIRNAAQLAAIGTGAAVTSTDNEEGQLGQGTPVTNADGAQITYSPDAQYQLVNDIPLTAGSIWNLPAGFTGSFTSGDGSAVTKDAPLYDSATDTIYVYNSYQLDLICSENAANEPVMSNDMIAEEFGMGQLVYPDGTPAEGDEAAAQEYLTYGPEHNYVLAMEFTAERPELKAEAVVQAEGDHRYGRQYEGQVIWKDSDETEYILIGNKTQLEAIGKEKSTGGYIEVTGAAYTRPVVGPDLEYCGDADLDWSDKNNGGELLDGANKAIWYGVNEGDKKPDLGTLGWHATGKYYSPDENYIIFRNIDLSGKNWQPMMFSGHMEGRLDMGDSPVTISNITVNQSGEMDIEQQLGIGFFATIGNKSDNSSIGKSAGTASVKNLNLQTVSVTNNFTKAHYDPGLVSGLLQLVADVVSGIFGIVTWIPGVGDIVEWLLKQLGLANLDEVVEQLLTATTNDPAIFATGAFAGRIVGDVKVENCHVYGVSVNNSKENAGTGGFAGNISGTPRYSALDGALGNLVYVLTELLNIIPGLDLGTLIQVLLGENGLINVGNLIPIGYYSPLIDNCSVSDFDSSSIGSDSINYVGGFAGRLEGATVKNSSVGAANESLTVTAKMFAGGFSGVMRNADVKGLLSELKIELIKPVALQTIVTTSQILSSTEVKAEKYAGGFTGIMANSYAVNDSVNNLKSVVASGTHAGGFAGKATLGWATTLGKELGEKTEGDLLSTLGNLLSQVTSGEDTSMILSLSGVCPSAIAGVTISGANDAGYIVKAEGKDNLNASYAGGIYGEGDGVLVFSSSAENISGLTGWSWRDGELGNILANLTSQANTVSNLSSVSGAGDYVGGIAGFAKSAEAASILGATVGAISYLPFEIEDLTINENKGTLSVSGGNYVSGGIGKASGGNVTNVKLYHLASVTGENYCGGFVGGAGAASVADAGGLNILGLNLIKISSLLSVAACIETKFTNVHVSGVDSGFTVEAQEDAGEVGEHAAGGFIGYSASTEITDCTVDKLKTVSANGTDGKAGGFAGTTDTGKLLDVAKENQGVLNIVDIQGLIGAVSYLLPEFTRCTVTFVSAGQTEQGKDNPQASGYMAGGFAGDIQSAQINYDISESKEISAEGTTYDGYAVKGLKRIEATGYAGGFAGNIEAGGLADVADGGLGLLNGLLGDSLDIKISRLLSVFNTYIPHICNASVQSLDNEETKEIGFTVEATDQTKSYAGGYAGYASGAVINGSNVECLKNTKVTAPADLETHDQDESACYFDRTKSDYAVAAASSAGGFAGTLDIGNVAAVGDGIGILGTLTGVDNLLDVLDVAASKVTDCNVKGSPGGFNVLASGDAGKNDPIGHAGGFVGDSRGTIITNSDTGNFEYIIGRESAGGYAGTLQPGDVASVAENAQVLGGLVELTSLAQVLQSFVPSVINSQTSAVPCGGIVRAENLSSETGSGEEKVTRERGMAGGFVGHSLAGQIEGEKDGGKECAAYRIRSVYGAEFAGGYTGHMEAANVADTGSVSLLYGLVEVENPIQLLSAVYATEKHTAVYGPLRGLTQDEWNSWVDFVGKNGAYGSFIEKVEDSGGVSLDQQIADYAYGFRVEAGRDEAGRLASEGGVAGGYVGRMDGGTITDGLAKDIIEVRAMRSAGGFVGEMMSANVADVGGANLAGLDIVESLPLLELFVPVINGGNAEGYRSGFSVDAYGRQTDGGPTVGYAGGYAGRIVGGQIGMEEGSVNNATKLRRVDGTYLVGGYAGGIESGSAVDINTEESGLLNQLLTLLLRNPGDLVSVLNATISTIDGASVKAVDPWGFTVNGAYSGSGSEGQTMYALAAGGFAGSISGAVIGNKGERELTGNADGSSEAASVTVENVRQVTGGQHAGGFAGVADAGSIASLAEDEGQQSTTILSLIGLGHTEVADMFRSYIFHAAVSGSTDNGLRISANEGKTIGSDETGAAYTGNAGGFAGSFENSTVEESAVTGLNSVDGINNAGGFIGYSGKSGLVNLKEVSVGDETGEVSWNLLGGSAGVLDVFGSTMKNCTASGMEAGFTVKSTGGVKERAGGFIGYADLSRVTGCHVTNLKQVASDYRAGGFAGETSYAYLASVKLDSELVEIITTALGKILEALYLDKLEELDLISLGIPGFLEVKVLGDGNLAYVNLLGLKIQVQLVGDKNTAKISIGDSEITLIRDKDGNWTAPGGGSIQIDLIKANRTRIAESSVEGIADGYDVFGGGADQTADGTDKPVNGGDFVSQEEMDYKAAAGGFIGYNKEGLLENNDMYFCDTIRSSSGTAGTFTGVSDLDTSYDYNQKNSVEGNDNVYRIYRRGTESENLGRLTQISRITSQFMQEEQKNEKEKAWSNIYVINNLNDVDSAKNEEDFPKLKGRSMTDGGSNTELLEAYISPAMAVLMENVETTENEDSLTPEPPDMQDPCDEYIDPDITKVWDDKSNKWGQRPTEITVDIWQKLEDESEDEWTLLYTVVITGDMDENIWDTITPGIPELPAWTMVENAETGEKEQKYYEYSVTEREVSGYYTKVEPGKTYIDGEEVTVKDEPFSYVITNQSKEQLPDAGGMGTRLLYLAGILLVMGAALSYIRSRSRMAEAAAGNGRPGNPGGRRRVRRRQRIHDRHSRR